MLRGGLVRIDPSTRTSARRGRLPVQPRLADADDPAAGDRRRARRPARGAAAHRPAARDDQVRRRDRRRRPARASGRQAANLPVAEQGLLPALAVLERLVTPTRRRAARRRRAVRSAACSRSRRWRRRWWCSYGASSASSRCWSSGLSFTEEGFDPHLQPIRVKASIECKVLTSSDLPLQHVGRHPLHRLPPGGRAAGVDDHQPPTSGPSDWSTSHECQPVRQRRARPSGSRPTAARIPYLRRRLLPAAGSPHSRHAVPVAPGDRIDTIAERRLGDPTLSWQLGDANLAIRPTELATARAHADHPAARPGAASGQ